MVCWLPTAGQGQATTRVNMRYNGTQPYHGGFDANLSADGHRVAFSTLAALVPGDLNGEGDVFLHDLTTGAIEIVSVDSRGRASDGYSSEVFLSADGSILSFQSHATNLVPADANGVSDIFVRDRIAGITELVSKSSSGVPSDGPSYFSVLSADGRYVAFDSDGAQLVPHDTNGWRDVFVHDRRTGSTERVSIGTQGEQGNQFSWFPSISADGRFVAFRSDADNLVPGDVNGVADIFVRDRLMETTELVSVGAGGVQGNGFASRPSISADGRCVAFESQASNLVPGGLIGMHVYLHDRLTRITERVSVNDSGVAGDGASTKPSISADGRWVAFESAASNMVPGDTNQFVDLFVRDRQLGVTERVSVDSLGLEANAHSFGAKLCADGSRVAFDSYASNLVPGDTNQTGDCFLRDRGPSSGATANNILLAAQVHFSVDRRVQFSWYGAPPGSRWWLLDSAQNQGAVIAGHAFGVGPGGNVVATGLCDSNGTGAYLTAPFPAWTAGRTVYVEVGARDAGGRIYDSNVLERIVQ